MRRRGAGELAASALTSIKPAPPDDESAEGELAAGAPTACKALKLKRTEFSLRAPIISLAGVEGACCALISKAGSSSCAALPSMPIMPPLALLLSNGLNPPPLRWSSSRSIAAVSSPPPKSAYDGPIAPLAIRVDSSFPVGYPETGAWR